MALFDNLFVSPHIDDAFLSLGGTIISRASQRQKILDVFCVSAFAPRGNCPKGDIDCVSKLRREEELLNCKFVGSDVDFLNFLDAPLRGFKEPTQVPNYHVDMKLHEQVKTEVRTRVLDSENVYFPLAIGRHVDHMIINRIGLELALEERIVEKTYFYEDLPYSAMKQAPYSLIDAKRDKAMLSSVLVSFPARKKWKLCSTYKSPVLKSSLAKNYEICQVYQAPWNIL